MINTSAGISTVFQQGISGMQNSSRSITESANEIVLSGTLERAPLASTDIVEPMINIQQEQHVFNASAKIIDVADQALGALIDIEA
ncbi:MAG: flagellar hook-associated protein FlgK [Candidatus Endobugula sp.]|jgi:flagellar hook-associated protein FlgK